MSYYRADRIEKKNRRKAIVITTLIYLGAFAFIAVKDDINWKEYNPFAKKVATQDVAKETNEVATREGARP